jgi:hypothetical protein
MAISKDLLNSILAMDAYNRGYEAGIDGLPDQGDTQIGNAKISRRLQDVPSGFQQWAETAGFYAISYTISGTLTDLDGKTVISYRGTDKNIPTLTGSGSDLINGSGLALGSYSPRPNLEGPADSSFRAGLH